MMLKKFGFGAAAATVAAAMFATTANAQITFDGFVTHQTTTTGTAFAFDASGSDKLVIVGTSEHGFNNANGRILGGTYDPDGAGPLDPLDLNLAVFRDPLAGGTETTHGSIWYLDNPGGDGNGIILMNTINREAITAMGLSGTAPGVGATNFASESKSVGLTTTAAGSAVVAAHHMGGSGNTADVNNVDADAPLTEDGAIEFGSNWGGHVSAHVLDAGAAGAKTYSFTGGSTTGIITMAAEFLAASACNPGDTDGDGDIDTGDLTTSIQNFTGAGGSTTKTCEEGDTDEDGDVDTGDLTFSIQNFTGAQAGNAGVPDLVYDPATGNVTIDADGADVISFSLQSGPFNAADFSELPAGLTDNIASQIGWTSFNLFSGLTGTADLGAILPAGLDLAGLEAALTTASYGLALAGGGGGGRLDLIIPEPASMVLMGLGAMALVRRRRAA